MILHNSLSARWASSIVQESPLAYEGVDRQHTHCCGCRLMVAEEENREQFRWGRVFSTIAGAAEVGAKLSDWRGGLIIQAVFLNQPPIDH